MIARRLCRSCLTVALVNVVKGAHLPHCPRCGGRLIPILSPSAAKRAGRVPVLHRPFGATLPPADTLAIT